MEIFDIVDENGNPTGQTIERSPAHTNLVSDTELYIFGLREKLMGSGRCALQKRALTKIPFQVDMIPHQWDIYGLAMNHWNRQP